MDIKNLSDVPAGDVLKTDLLIIGGGAAGLSIAREFFDTSIEVLIAESGDVNETDEHERLNEVEFQSKTVETKWDERRRDYITHQTKKWSADVQRFGTRCRGLGGSTAAWAGKSAAFTEIDYRERDWVNASGWPIDVDAVEPYLRRAEQALNLGYGHYGDTFWENYKGKNQKPALDPKVFSSFFWQFARSRLNPVDMMRMGPEFMRETPTNVSVLVNATAQSVTPVGDGSEPHTLVELTGIDASPVTVSARRVVIACGAIENARLLLESTDTNPSGLGNENDQVGRYLTDHLHASLVKFDEKDVKTVTDQFGFFGLQSEQRVDMYSHGLGLGAETQEREGLLNTGVFCVSERAPDDPWSAVAGLLRGKSEAPFQDILTILKSPGLIITGAGRIFLQRDWVPQKLKMFVINIFVRFMPNFVVEEYQSEGLPRKLIGCGFDALVEQEPLADNRVVLSETRNALGQRLPLVIWEPGEKAVKSLMRTAELLEEEFERAGLPVPTPLDWVKEKNIEDAPIIDVAHTSGTTRMSTDPSMGVVDENCKIHTCEGIYIAGGSVFPTCSHTNTTLMIVSLALRLSDHLKAEFRLNA